MDVVSEIDYVDGGTAIVGFFSAAKEDVIGLTQMLADPEAALVGLVTMAATLNLSDTIDSIQNYVLSNWDNPEAIGKLTFHVMSAVIPAGGGAKLAKSGLSRGAKFAGAASDWMKYSKSTRAGMKQAKATSSLRGKYKTLEKAGFSRSQAREMIARGDVCFVAGTLVKTGKDSKKIEEVKEGDIVFSQNDQTGEQGYKKVLNTFVTHPNKLYHLSYSSSKQRPTTNNQLITTGEHPFYSAGKWTPAKQLRVDDQLVLSNGKTVKVTAIEVEHAPQGQSFTTYNFEVADWHTYFVMPIDSESSDGIFVHNSGLDCTPVAGKRARKYGPGGTLGQKAPSNWTQHILNNSNDSIPEWMKDLNPHGHHIGYKKGIGLDQQLIADEIIDILEDFDIDWYRGMDNLIIAPNNGHNITNLTSVRDAVKAASQSKSQKRVIEALRREGMKFRNRLKPQ